MVFIFNLAPFLSRIRGTRKAGHTPANRAFPILDTGSAYCVWEYWEVWEVWEAWQVFPGSILSTWPLFSLSTFNSREAGFPHFGHPVPSFWTLVLHSVFMGLMGPIGPTGLMGVLGFPPVRFVRFCQPFWIPGSHGLPGHTACPPISLFQSSDWFRDCGISSSFYI